MARFLFGMVVVLSPSRVLLLWPHGLQPVRLLCPWDSPVKNTGVACRFFLQGIFPTQELNLGLLPFGQILYPLSYKERSFGVDTQLFQDHLLKRLSLLYCMAFALLSKINWLCLWEFISGIFILFHWSVCLFFCQYHTLLDYYIFIINLEVQ